jgi:ATP-binding cassette subfamily C (CFTR/MRP) protein 1
VGQSFPGIFAAYVSLQRIDKFLSMEEKQPLPLISTTDEKEKGKDTAGLIQLEDASFVWAISGQPVLRDTTFTLQPGVLYMCVGPVASVSLPFQALHLIN